MEVYQDGIAHPADGNGKIWKDLAPKVVKACLDRLQTLGVTEMQHMHLAQYPGYTTYNPALLQLHPSDFKISSVILPAKKMKPYDIGEPLAVNKNIALSTWARANANWKKETKKLGAHPEKLELFDKDGNTVGLVSRPSDTAFFFDNGWESCTVMKTGVVKSAKLPKPDAAESFLTACKDALKQGNYKSILE